MYTVSHKYQDTYLRQLRLLTKFTCQFTTSTVYQIIAYRKLHDILPIHRKFTNGKRISNTHVRSNSFETFILLNILSMAPVPLLPSPNQVGAVPQRPFCTPSPNIPFLVEWGVSCWTTLADSKRGDPQSQKLELGIRFIYFTDYLAQNTDHPTVNHPQMSVLPVYRPLWHYVPPNRPHCTR